MSDTVHKTNVTHHLSVNTADYPTDDYIINPDLTGLYVAATGVYTVALKYWKVSGESVLEMTAGEKTAVDDAEAAAAAAAATAITVDGSRDGNAALADLLTILDANGIIIDSTTA